MKKTISFLVFIVLLGFTSLQAHNNYNFIDFVPSDSITECEADFYYEADSSGQNSFQFFDISTSTLPIFYWFWDFGDGTYSSDQNPAHTFVGAGTYNVCLSIESGDSGTMCTSTYCLDVIVQNGGGGNDCEAGFYYSSDSTGGANIVSFYDQSTPVGSIYSWSWDFNDGTYSAEQNPVHTFADAGTYNVCLTIASGDSGTMCTSTYCQDVIVQNGGGGNDCEADFYYSSDSTGGANIVSFYDQSTPVGSIYSWSWDFNDGTYSAEQNPVHTFADAGTYNVCLTIASGDSGTMCTSTYCQDVIVQNGGGGNDCEADFYYSSDSTGSANIVSFYDQSTPVGSIYSWSWDFNDGTYSAEQNPVHTFADAGTYNVCLTIASGDSGTMCTSTYCENITIQISDNLYLGGNVFADIYQLDIGSASLYQEANGTLTQISDNIIDSLGYYLFYPLAAGEYYSLAAPSSTSAYFGTHVPTYYGDAALWADATLISLDDNFYSADINLIPIVSMSLGSGIISGEIVYGTVNKMNTPAIGVQIMLANDNNEFVALTYSDDNGKFDFSSLPLETFVLYAEVMGIEMTPEAFTLSSENQSLDDISMIMTDDEIYFGPTGIESLYVDEVSEIYPNPVSNKLRLDIGVNMSTKIMLNVYNQVGQKLIMEQINIDNTQTIEINTSALKAGMYFLEIMSEDNYPVTRKFIKQ